MGNDIQTLVVGGGLAGMSTAYHLTKKGVDTMVIEAGKIGRGSDDMISGTASIPKPSHTKMITTPFDSDYAAFSRMHGKEGARTYLELSSAGRELQKSLARELNPELVRELGSLAVGHGTQLNSLRKEYKNYKRIGYGDDLRFFSREQIHQIYKNKKTAFDGGLFIPKDAIIDADMYLWGLKGKGSISVAEKMKVSGIEEMADGVRVRVDGDEMTADNVIIATNGFYNDKNLEGLLDKRWSFAVSYGDEGPNTPNTWEFSDKYCYFTRQDNVLMVAGEDKPVINGNTRFSIHEHDAFSKLTKWANEKFPSTKGKTPIATHFGICTYTPDEIPIVGKFDKNSRISYIVGCNGVGQSTLSYAALLMPGILGYDTLTLQQKRIADFLSPTRKTLKK